jgi:muramoyltetrapeptide carboxypeptidase
MAPALREGDSVALIAPAGPLKSDDEFERAQDIVRALGLVPKIGTFAKASALGYLAGTDEQRAADFNEAVRDSQVRGIFALRGGYGTMRILDRIDYDAVARSPKVILGYSDLTALLNSLAQETGLITFHGPVAALSQFTALETQALRAAVMTAEPLGVLHAPEAETLVDGVASGRIAGGNLSLIASLIGTPYEIDTSGALLVVEEVDESPYRIDRMLTQLRMSGALTRAAGIIAGGWTNCGVTGELLRDRLGDLGIPVLTETLIGHIDEQWTLPVGAYATLDSGARTLTFDEAAVRVR